jgi:hypothetical protein
VGYGGIFKSVVKIAATAFGAWACGPPCAAIGSAVATGATGGSFKESLMAGATTFATASFAQGLSNSINSAAAGATQVGAAGQIPAFDTGYFTAAGPQTFADISTGIGTSLADVSQQAAVNVLTDVPSSVPFLGDTALDLVSQPINSSGLPPPDVSQFIESEFGALAGVPRTGFDVFGADSAKTLRDLGFESAVPTDINNLGDLVAQGTGGLLDLTLSQALNSDLPEVDAMLATRWNPEQILALKNEARNALSQSAFDRLTGVDGGAVNPFGETPEGLEEFESVIARGIENRNIALGPATATDITASFENPNFGPSILNQERLARINSFGQDIGGAFPGDAFGGTLNDRIVDEIIKERQGPAEKRISAYGARGNLNPTGGQTANLFIQGQVPEARKRVEEVGTTVLGGGQRDVDVIRGRAEEQAGGYKLGEGLFDVAPFSEERTGLIEERKGTFGTDIREAIGPEPLFDVTGALQAGGRAQGVVSGRGQNPALLDQIAARELGSLSARNRRSLGSRGSGAF